MPIFAYKAITVTGKRVKGSVDSSNAAALSRSLEQQGLFVLSIDSAEEGTDSTARRGSFTGHRREVLEVTRALAALLPAGMPLAQALKTSSNVSTGYVSAALDQIRIHVERGESLAAALATYPSLFSPLYIGLVRAGERSGNLDESFAKLAIQLERDEEIRSKLVSSMIYPMLLAFVGGIAVTILLIFILPRFVELLQNSGAELPGSTSVLLAIASAVRGHWYALLLIPIIGYGIVRWTRNSKTGELAFAKFMLAAPLIRSLRQTVLAAQFSRIVGVLISGGAPLLSALDDCIESIGDPIAKSEITGIREKVREGASLKRSITESTLFPPLLAQLVGIGEDSGRLRDFFEKAADIFEEKAMRSTQRLATLAEPAMILFFGTIVGFIALSLLQAIYGINASSFK